MIASALTTGLVLVRSPGSLKREGVARLISEAISGLSQEDILGQLIVISPSRVRARPLEEL